MINPSHVNFIVGNSHHSTQYPCNIWSQLFMLFSLIAVIMWQLTNLVPNSLCTYLVASENYPIALCRRKTELYPKWFAITVKKQMWSTPSGGGVEGIAAQADLTVKAKEVKYSRPHFHHGFFCLCLLHGVTNKDIAVWNSSKLKEETLFEAQGW